MTPSAIPRYLIGRRSAIVEIVHSPTALLCGLLFVISAGLARDYDGEDLIHEPWHALRPLAASLLSGTILFIVVHSVAVARTTPSGSSRPSILRSYLVFLALFWMTAPMAWLYAIPYERFLSPVHAVEMNLWTLAAVSVWRVALITRVISVVYGVRAVSAFFLVMLFADTVVIAAVHIAPLPVIDLMGGIRYDPGDRLLADVRLSAQILSIMSLVVWIIGAGIAAARLKPTWADFTRANSVATNRRTVGLAVASVLVWIPALAIAQPEQMNRHQAETLLDDGAVAEALAFISSRRQEDFPPHWNPPPRMGYREPAPDLDRVRLAMEAKRPAAWITRLYVSKIRRRLEQELIYSAWLDLPEIVDHLEQSWRLYEVAAAHAETIAFIREHDDHLTESERMALLRLHGASGLADPAGLTDTDKRGVLDQAIIDGNVELVRNVLSAGVGLEEPAPVYKGYTPLAQAALQNNVEVVQLLIDAGASLETRSGSFEFTPLFWAANAGADECVQALLIRGADPSAGTPAFPTLLFAAAWSDQADTIRLLIDLDLGISLAQCNSTDGDTAAQVAHKRRSTQAFDALVAAGADSESQGDDNGTAETRHDE